MAGSQVAERAERMMESRLITATFEDARTTTGTTTAEEWETTKSIARETEGGSVVIQEAEAGYYEVAVIPGTGVYRVYFYTGQ